MHELIILSPHRDDAVFSLGLSLLKWSRLPVKLKIVNFFTVSTYGPRAVSTAVGSVTAVRQREDHQVLRSIDRRIQIRSLDLLDAPLRLGITSDSVCKPQLSAAQSTGQCELLTLRVRRYFHEGLVLAPLALGDHIDHLAVKGAAIAASYPQKLAFYEDLPYATWTDQSAILGRVSATSEATGTILKPHIMHIDHAVPRKCKLVRAYRSQIDLAAARQIARFALTYGGGERIWIPKHSSHWRTLTA